MEQEAAEAVEKSDEAEHGSMAGLQPETRGSSQPKRSSCAQEFCQARAGDGSSKILEQELTTAVIYGSLEGSVVRSCQQRLRSS